MSTLCGGGIEPLDIVDADEQRPFAGQHREHAEGGEGDRSLQRLFALGPPQQQRHLEGTALWLGKLGKSVTEISAQQIAERGIYQLELRLDRPAEQHPVRAIFGRSKARLPQRRLPDSGFTLEKQRDRSALDRTQEPVQAP